MRAPIEAPMKHNDPTSTVTSPHWLQWFQQSFDRLMLSFNGRFGAVVPQTGDYTAAQVGADPAGTAAAGDAAHLLAFDHPGHNHSGGDGGQIDHDQLDGLGDDDHSQYLLLAGRPGQRAVGPLIIGGVTDNTTVEADGTQKKNGAATTWVDIDFPVIVKTVGVGVPALNTLQGNLQMLQWAVNDAQQIEVKEQIHLWKEASTGYWHCHIITGGTDVTDRYLRFEIEWTWANFGATIAPNIVVTSPDMLIPANTPALTHIAFDIGQAAFPDGRIAAHIKARVKRVAAVGTAPTANPFCEMFQMHVECDTDGSRQQWTK